MPQMTTLTQDKTKIEETDEISLGRFCVVKEHKENINVIKAENLKEKIVNNRAE